jgi:cobalt-precorrin 5A hydrolase
MIVAGLGFRRGVKPAEVERALDRALRILGPVSGLLDCLAVPVRKAGEAAPSVVARTRGLQLVVIPQEALEAAAAQTVSRSVHALRTMNVPSVAEAAALAGAGRGARLLVPKVVEGSVTCALAEGDGKS